MNAPLPAMEDFSRAVLAGLTSNTAVMRDIKFNCTHCGQSLFIDSRAKGYQVECPTCLQQITVRQNGNVRRASFGKRLLLVTCDVLVHATAHSHTNTDLQAGTNP